MLSGNCKTNGLPVECLVVRFHFQRSKNCVIAQEYDVSHHVSKFVFHLVDDCFRHLLVIIYQVHQGGRVLRRSEQGVRDSGIFIINPKK